jgi:hypothetical protein
MAKLEIPEGNTLLFKAHRAKGDGVFLIDGKISLWLENATNSLDVEIPRDVARDMARRILKL